MALTDTREKRLVVIVAVAVLLLGSGTIFVQVATEKADDKADRLLESVSQRVSDVSYEEVFGDVANWIANEDPSFLPSYTVGGVIPELISSTEEEAIRLQWQTGAMATDVCITAVWRKGSVVALTERSC